MKKSNIFSTSGAFSAQLLLVILFLYCITLLLLPGYSHAASKHEADSHYNEVGFFDLHVCNWPKRPLFFMALFSTTQFNNIKNIRILDNKNKRLAELDLTKYRTLMLKKPTREKRVFLKQIDIPKTSSDGWYSVKVLMKDGRVITAKDYVIFDKLDIATDTKPAARTTLKSIPKNFSWKPIPGAQHYQVFITDYWNNNSVYSSDLLSKPKFTPPPNILKSGGAYCWRVHARDTNEHILLGDFNHGSLTQCFEFDIQ